MKKKNNSGFTLTELVVVMAVSSIFLGMVMVILASSLNLFNKNEKQSNIFSDTVIIDNMANVFIDEINNNGYSLIFDSSNEKIYYGNSYLDVDDNSNTIYLKIDSEENKRDENKVYSDITIDIKYIDDNSFSLVYMKEEKVIKTTVFNVLGGISHE